MLGDIGKLRAALETQGLPTRVRLTTGSFQDSSRTACNVRVLTVIGTYKIYSMDLLACTVSQFLN